MGNPYSAGVKKLALPALTCALLLTACPASGGGGNPPPAGDTTAPTVSLSQGATTTSGKITLTAAVADNVGVKKVEFYQGTTLLGTDTQAPYTFDVEYITDRTNFTAKASDAAGNVGTSAAFNITTLYQGIWAWAIADASGTLIDSGAVVNLGELPVQTRVAAIGFYFNETETKEGLALMGPIAAAGKLQAAFSLGNTFDTGYFAGEDTDNTMGTYQGKALFEGTGSIVDAAGNAVQDVVIVILQSSTEIPAPAGAKIAAQRAARTDAERLAVQTRPPLQAQKTSPAILRAAAAAVLNR